VALWATQKLLPPVPGGEFARGIARGRAAALELDRRLRADKADRFQPLLAGAPELDIVVWKLRAQTAELSSALAQKVFDACATRDLHLALAQLPRRWFEPDLPLAASAESVTCLRSVLMKPEHEAWLDEIWQRLTASCDEVMGA
jgi:hypothetical protein